ncbi:MAG TPA: glutathione S-transferase family protein [Oxalicibacterium sp.]|nr:glutathione S-transferase family protein [Oxalicibacterium sp.]
MRLYHNAYSTNSHRVVLTARHLGIPLDLVSVDLMSPADREKLVRINPNSKIPVLEDGELMLWESCAIMQYLAEKTPGQTIYPSDARSRADVHRWLFWCAQHFSPAVSLILWENCIKGMIGGGDPDPHEVARGELQLAQFARVLDDHLARREWICGDGLTLADMAIASPLMVSERAKLPVRQYRHVQAWFARMQSLDAWKLSIAH